MGSTSSSVWLVCQAFPTAVGNGLALCHSPEPGGRSAGVFPAGFGLGTRSSTTGEGCTEGPATACTLGMLEGGLGDLPEDTFVLCPPGAVCCSCWECRVSAAGCGNGRSGSSWVCVLPARAPPSESSYAADAALSVPRVPSSCATAAAPGSLPSPPVPCGPCTRPFLEGQLCVCFWVWLQCLPKAELPDV